MQNAPQKNWEHFYILNYRLAIIAFFRYDVRLRRIPIHLIGYW